MYVCIMKEEGGLLGGREGLARRGKKREKSTGGGIWAKYNDTFVWKCHDQPHYF